MASEGASQPHSPNGEERRPQKGEPEQMVTLSAISALSIILLDVGTFIRNNHMLYTASFSRAMREFANGNPCGSDILESLDGMLEKNTEYLRNISDLCVQTIEELKRVSS